MQKYFEFKKPDCIDKEDEVEQEVAEEGGEDEGSPAPGVGEGARHQREEDPGGTLQHPVISLQLTNILLSRNLEAKIFKRPENLL